MPGGAAASVDFDGIVRGTVCEKTSLLRLGIPSIKASALSFREDLGSQEKQ